VRETTSGSDQESAFSPWEEAESPFVITRCVADQTSVGIAAVCGAAGEGVQHGFFAALTQLEHDSGARGTAIRGCAKNSSFGSRTSPANGYLPSVPPAKVCSTVSVPLELTLNTTP